MSILRDHFTDIQIVRWFVAFLIAANTAKSVLIMVNLIAQRLGLLLAST